MFKVGDKVVFLGYMEDVNYGKKLELWTVLEIMEVAPETKYPYRTTDNRVFLESELILESIYNSPVYQLIKD